MKKCIIGKLRLYLDFAQVSGLKSNFTKIQKNCLDLYQKSSNDVCYLSFTKYQILNHLKHFNRIFSISYTVVLVRRVKKRNAVQDYSREILK